MVDLVRHRHPMMLLFLVMAASMEREQASVTIRYDTKCQACTEQLTSEWHAPKNHRKKLAPYGTDGRLLLTADFNVT